MSFEVHLLTQSLTEPTTEQERQLHRVLSYIKGTLHSTLSLQPTRKRAEEKAQSLELLAFSASSWTEACRPTSTVYLTLWGVPLIASCRTSGAYRQEDAELDAVRLALGLASHTRSFLQHLDLDHLGTKVNISLRTSSLHNELVKGRPLAMQLGLSRRNKHIPLKCQLQLSKVHPKKNLAHSLTNNASGKRMLAKLRVDTEAAGTLALSTVRGQDVASFGVNSSFLVGMVAAEPSLMEKPQLRKPACFKSVSFVRTCLESLSRNFADKSVTSLTLHSLSLQRSKLESLTLPSWSLPIDSLTLPSLSRTGDRFHSLTLHSLSLTKGNLQSLTLQSLSLIAENRLQTISFKEAIFGEGSLEETAESFEHSFAERGAGTNSFPHLSFPKEDQRAAKEAETNSFFTQSFSDRILSLSIWLRIFWLSSFQLTCAALLLGTYSVSMSFPNESLQSEELVTAYFSSSLQQQSLQQDELETAYSQSPTRASKLQHRSLKQQELYRSSFQRLSDQLCRSTLDSFNQLDLEISLSLTWLGSTRCREQLQSTSFDKSSFEHRVLPCAALIESKISRQELDHKQVQSFQLPMQQLCLGLVQGGAQHTAFNKIALSTRSLKRSLPATAWQTSASPTAFTTTSTRTTTRSLRRTLLSGLWFSFLIITIFISNSFWGKELVDHNELSQTVQSFPLDPLHDHLGKELLWTDQFQHKQLQEEQVPDRELRQLHLQQLHQQDQSFKGTKQLPKEHSFTSCLLRQMISSFSKKELERLNLTRSNFEQDEHKKQLEQLLSEQLCGEHLAERNLFQVQLVIYKFFPENSGQQLSEKQLQQNLSTDQQQLQDSNLAQTVFQQISLEQPSFTEKILHNELATNFDKKSLEENLFLSGLLL